METMAAVAVLASASASAAGARSCGGTIVAAATVGAMPSVLRRRAAHAEIGDAGKP